MNRLNFIIDGKETVGFTDKTAFPEPEDETEVRAQLNSLHTQTKDFINLNVCPEIEELQNGVVKNITSDGSITITKDGSNVLLSVSIAGGGATIAYVDREVSFCNTDAKTYTDNKCAETLNSANINAENKARDLVTYQTPYPIRIVDALPANPDPNIMYFVKE